MFGFLKKLTNRENVGCNDVKAIAKCPKCGKEVIETGDYWACIDVLSGTCTFRMKNILNGKKMDINILAEYQKAEEYQYIYNVINNKVADMKTDKINAQNNNLANKDKFFKKAKMLEQGCVNCGRPIYRLGDTVRCVDQKCNFEAKTVYGGVNFSDEQMSQLLGRSISEEYTFKNSSTGDTFTGRVFFDFDRDVKLTSKYKFVDDISKLDKRYFKYVYAPEKDGRVRIPLKELLD